MTTIPTFSRAGRRAAGTAATPAVRGNDRLWLPLAVVAAAVLAVAGWMLFVSPVRSESAGIQSQTAVVSQQAATLRAQLVDLQAQQADLPRYQAELEAAQAAMPTTAAMPEFLRTLQTLGTTTGTTVTGLNATAPDGTTVATGNGARGVGNVYKIPVSVTVTGSYDGLTAFVKALQQNQPRAVLVDSVNEAPGEGGALILTVSMTAFVAPTSGATSGG